MWGGSLGSSVRMWGSERGKRGTLIARLLLWTTGIWSQQAASQRACGTPLRIISKGRGSQGIIYLQIPALIYQPIRSTFLALLACLERSQADSHGQRTPQGNEGSHQFANYPLEKVWGAWVGKAPGASAKVPLTVTYPVSGKHTQVGQGSFGCQMSSSHA